MPNTFFPSLSPRFWYRKGRKWDLWDQFPIKTLGASLDQNIVHVTAFFVAQEIHMLGAPFRGGSERWGACEYFSARTQTVILRWPHTLSLSEISAVVFKYMQSPVSPSSKSPDMWVVLGSPEQYPKRSHLTPIKYYSWDILHYFIPSLWNPGYAFIIIAHFSCDGPHYECPTATRGCWALLESTGVRRWE